MNMSVCALVYLFVDYELAIKQLKRVKSLLLSDMSANVNFYFYGLT